MSMTTIYISPDVTANPAVLFLRLVVSLEFVDQLKNARKIVIDNSLSNLSIETTPLQKFDWCFENSISDVPVTHDVIVNSDSFKFVGNNGFVSYSVDIDQFLKCACDDKNGECIKIFSPLSKAASEKEVSQYFPMYRLYDDPRLIILMELGYEFYGFYLDNKTQVEFKDPDPMGGTSCFFSSPEDALVNAWYQYAEDRSTLAQKMALKYEEVYRQKYGGDDEDAFDWFIFTDGKFHEIFSSMSVDQQIRHLKNGEFTKTDEEIEVIVNSIIESNIVGIFPSP